MHLRIIFLFSFFLTSIVFAALVPEEKNRPKRTLKYFFEGLISVFNIKRSNMQTRGASNDHKTSPESSLAMLSKLSSISTPPRIFEAIEDAEINRDSHKNTIRNSASNFIQIAIPTIAPMVLINTTIPNLPTYRKLKNEMNITHSSEIICALEPSSNTPNERNHSELPVTFDPNIKAEDSNEETSTVPNNAIIETNKEKCCRDSGDIKTLQFKLPFKASDRRYTSLFDSPLISGPLLEHHGQHIPAYVEHFEIMQGDGEESHPFSSSNAHKLLLTISVPVNKSKNEQKNKHEFSKLYALHKAPIIHLHQPHIQFSGNPPN